MPTLLYNLNDTTNAVRKYQNLSESPNRSISSIAEQQLGQIMYDKKQYEPALEHYKNALRKNPANHDARYNYELLKKILRKQEEEQKDKENQDQENKDQKDQDKENKEQEKKDQDQEQEGEKSEEKEKEQPKPTPSDKLKEMNISEEKAKMILEAMKNNEIQYIQQNRRKATKKKESDKPDW